MNPGNIKIKEKFQHGIVKTGESLLDLSIKWSNNLIMQESFITSVLFLC